MATLDPAQDERGGTAFEPLAEWELARSEPGSDAPATDADWLPARAPGTVAGALREAGRTPPPDLDAFDWWYRTRFAGERAAGERVLLALDGLATVADVHLNGERLLRSESMFAEHEIDVSDRLGG